MNQRAYLLGYLEKTAWTPAQPGWADSRIDVDEWKRETDKAKQQDISDFNKKYPTANWDKLMAARNTGKTLEMDWLTKEKAKLDALPAENRQAAYQQFMANPKNMNRMYAAAKKYSTLDPQKVKNTLNQNSRLTGPAAPAVAPAPAAVAPASPAVAPGRQGAFAKFMDGFFKGYSATPIRANGIRDWTPAQLAAEKAERKAAYAQNVAANQLGYDPEYIAKHRVIRSPNPRAPAEPTFISEPSPMNKAIYSRPDLVDAQRRDYEDRKKKEYDAAIAKAKQSPHYIQNNG
jgi:hypothetical protein